MQWTARLISRPIACLAPALFACCVGCHQFPDVFVDELPDSSMVRTASSEYALRSEATDTTQPRGFRQIRVEQQDSAVVHGPLWFEDPVEMVGSDDGQFAVTYEEFLYFAPGAARWLVNIALLPISMIKDPPDVAMCSDGTLRRSHRTGTLEPFDAERCHGEAPLPEIDEVWAFDESVGEQFVGRPNGETAGEADGPSVQEDPAQDEE